jgi:hypothetical protein
VNIYKKLADIVALFHVAFVLILVAGVPLSFIFKWWMIIHLIFYHVRVSVFVGRLSAYDIRKIIAGKI